MNAVVVSILLGLFLSQSESRPISIGHIQQGRTILSTVAKRVDVEVRRLMIREGMAKAEVSQILGHKSVIFLAPSEPDSLILYYYIDYGIYINYKYDARGICRAHRVSLSDLPRPNARHGS